MTLASRSLPGPSAEVLGPAVSYRPTSTLPDMFGLLPSEYETVLDNLIHLTLGVLGIVVGFFVGRRSDSRLAH